ncbi:MAG: tRNA 2-thiouridine(34) synthase MnmA [Spirochaetes bacterium]|nr:tRNA 2-thiouridine(34) synthase MnmA [Spirochaetota bacterium]
MKIAVAMSGGIDSSVAALLLREQGHKIIGITARLSDQNNLVPGNTHANFFADQSVTDAKKIADDFNFEHHVVNLETDFESEIIKPFCEKYLSGETPSPCIICNAKIKFNRLIDIALSFDCDCLATGHYAAVKLDEITGRYFIKAAADLNKDQSYFLFMIDQFHLSKINFPLGGYTKDEIRDMARKFNLQIADKPDSQEICFIPDNDYKNFIEKYTGVKPIPGNIVKKDGTVIGRHTGIFHYTIGQRRGLGISDSSPLYVTEINTEKNEIVAGYQDELYRNGLIADRVIHMKTENLNTIAYIKTRSTQKKIKAEINEINDELKITFLEPLSQITPGQAVVIYNEENEILGGAWIKHAF